MLVNFFGPYKTDNGPVAVKCKKNYILKYNFFLLKIAKFIKKTNQKIFIFQNVKFEMSEYSNTTKYLNEKRI